MRNKIILLLIIILFIPGCTKKEEPVQQINPTDTQKFKSEYEQLNTSIVVNIKDDDKIKYLSVDETKDLLESKTGVIYFGMPTCKWCRNAVPVLLELLRQNNMTLNYLNPSEIAYDDISKFQEVKKMISDYLMENDKKEKILYVPDVYFVKKGKVIGHHLGSSPSQDNADIKMTESQKQELVDIYNKYLSELK